VYLYGKENDDFPKNIFSAIEVHQKKQKQRTSIYLFLILSVCSISFNDECVRVQLELEEYNIVALLDSKLQLVG